jgi:hypothetical protein
MGFDITTQRALYCFEPVASDLSFEKGIFYDFADMIINFKAASEG